MFIWALNCLHSKAWSSLLDSGLLTIPSTCLHSMGDRAFSSPLPQNSETLLHMRDMLNILVFLNPCLKLTFYSCIYVFSVLVVYSISCILYFWYWFNKPIIIIPQFSKITFSSFWYKHNWDSKRQNSFFYGRNI